MAQDWVKPVVLENDFVRLEPVSTAHASDLALVAKPEIYRYFVTLQPRACDEEGMGDFISRTLQVPNLVAFATIDKASGRAIGMTTYLDIRAEHRGLEIGFTWIAPAFQATKINPSAKLVQLTHAFEVLGAVRVQLKTDGRNVQSQAAITKLGATKEGVLRSHGIMLDGHIRDTVMYSILPPEWPAVKAGLIERLK